MTPRDIFARTTEDLLAARVEDLSWLAVPVDGGIKIASAWRLTKPLPQWTPMDFDGAEGIVADEATFRSHVQAVACHRCQLATLGRTSVDSQVATPWGLPNRCVRYAEGVLSYSTPSHGGFHVDRERLAAMPAVLRNKDGWFEEDCEWAKVATAFPDLFTAYECDHAERTLRDWMPDAWEAVHGCRLDASESYTREQQQFERDHAKDWVVISASRSDGRPDQIACVATQGGHRGNVPKHEFLVPRAEYGIGRHGFVIDPNRHPEI